MPGIRKVTMQELVQTNQYVTSSFSLQQKEASSKSILLVGAQIKPDSDLKCEYSAIIHLDHIKCVIRRVSTYYTRQNSSEILLTTKILQCIREIDQRLVIKYELNKNVNDEMTNGKYER